LTNFEIINYTKIFRSYYSQKILNLSSNSISLFQHGFLPKHYINTNLLVYWNCLINNLDQSHRVDSIYTDFEKAFDKVNHLLLFFKLKHFGFDGNFLNWLSFYLSNSSQVVTIFFSLFQWIFSYLESSTRISFGTTYFPYFY